jgi:hypothetical protein
VIFYFYFGTSRDSRAFFPDNLFLFEGCEEQKQINTTAYGGIGISKPICLQGSADSLLCFEPFIIFQGKIEDF